ncbi:MAG TPA: ATP-binding protein [Spirochaetota bacterium]|mgnify:CR=1 FL=1|nr:ATP-binding protein [Spirochaetota bacterium]HPJ36263.1 ATP-binding protein [Spirochaetota bacterium]
MEKSFRNKLNRLKLDILYLNSYQSVVILTILAVIISLFYSGEYGEAHYKTYVNTVWLPLSICIYLLKLICSIFYSKKLYIHDNLNFWRYVFYTTTTLTGLSLGSSVIFVSEMSSGIDRVFIILLISAVSSGSVSSLATSMISFIIFNSFAFLPYIIYYIGQESSDFSLVGYFILLFISTITLTAYRINKSLANSLGLKIENDIIIEKLIQTEDKFAKSFYSGVAPMAMFDFNTAKIIDVNNAMIELFEYSKDEIIGKSPYELDVNDNPEELIDLVTDAVRTGHISDKIILLKSRSGKIKHCMITIESFIVDSSTIAFIMLHDFTERIEYEKKLEIEREKAEFAAEAKSKFLASMSHEIRTPMNTILGMTNLALITGNEPDRNEYLNTVKDSAEYLLVLINDILDLSKVEAGRIELDIIDVDLSALLNSIYRLMEIHAKNRKLSFDITIEDNVPEYIKCAPERLKQILINLAGNALKFTPEGSITIRVSVSDGTDYPPSSDITEYLEFSITDTGIGIPENKQEEIFETFRQGDSSTFRKYGGTGLGLSISRQLIKAMNGRLKLKSIVGEGSTFSFIVPLIKGVKPAETALKTITSSVNETKKILIAEDNLLNRKLIEAFMSRLGHDYKIVENGEQVIELLKSDSFDLILMDLEMPVLDGYEAMKLIREGAAGEKNRNITIHAMSAHVMTSTVDKCIADGFNGYIKKPVDLIKLKAVIQQENLQ